MTHRILAAVAPLLVACATSPNGFNGLHYKSRSLGQPVTVAPGHVPGLTLAPKAGDEPPSYGAGPSGPVLLASHETAEPLANARLLDDCDADRSIVVHKAARKLELWCGEQLAARYDTSLGFAPEGAKRREGDGKTPEGEYYVTLKYPGKFHLQLQINYPNVDDAERGLREGLIGRAEHAAIVGANKRCANPPQDTALGSYIQIHGGGGGNWAGDWTLGCVAVDNPNIERVFAFHKAGCTKDGVPRTRVIIKR